MTGDQSYERFDSEQQESCVSKCTARKASKNTLLISFCILVGTGTLFSAIYTFVLASSTVHVGQIIHMSDFHLDAYYDSRLSVKCRCHWKPSNPTCNNPLNSTARSGKRGSYGCDSPVSLVKSAVEAAYAVSKKAKAILPVVVSGDYTRHATHDYIDPSMLVKNAFANVTTWMKNAGFKEVVGTWGNDDFAQNYYFDLSKSCQQQSLIASTSQEMKRLLPNLDSATTHSTNTINPTSMRCSGYYAYNLQETGIRILSLNTILYSVKHQPDYSDENFQDPEGQFAWMEEQLQDCLVDSSCRAVWILGHIAPGREYCMQSPSWKDIYVEKYLDILISWSPKNLIKAQLFGHEHINSIRLLSAEHTDLPPILLTAAVSPVYLNRPAFRVLDYDRDIRSSNFGHILDFTVFGMTGFTASDEWETRFTASDEFKLNNISSTSVLAWINSFTTAPMNQPFETFVKRSWDRDTIPPTGYSCPFIFPDICHLLYVREVDIEICTKKRSRD